MRVYIVREAYFASIEGAFSTLAKAAAFCKTKMYDLSSHEEYLSAPDRWGTVYRLRYVAGGAIAYDVIEKEIE